MTVKKTVKKNLKTLALDALSAAYRTFRPAMGPQTCRFVPSCSAYAFEAVQRHGIFKGTGLAAKRLSRCHPLTPGGFDPVP